MRLKSIIFSFLVSILLSPAMYGQQRQISGKVQEQDGTPIVGAGIVASQSNTYAATSAEGLFDIKAAVGEVVKVILIGYKEYSFTVTSSMSYVDITLVPDTELLDEVVVVGYGSMKKSDLTGSVASVKMDKLTDITSPSVDGLLQGRAAGLQVLNTSQDPGSTATVRIRGNSSINGSNAPLIVVNGFPMGDAGSLTSINPSDIASIEVLKDASASAIYGSRGANGVILVTTKNAQEGQFNVSVKHQTVVSQLSDKVDIWYDPLLMAEVVNEEQINAGLAPLYVGQTINGIYYPTLAEIKQGKWSNTDWQKLCLRTPMTNSTTVSINGAGPKASFNLSANYFNDQGIYQQDGYSKLNVNMGISYKLTEKVKISTYDVFSLTDRNTMNGLEYGRNPLWPVYNEDGTYYIAGASDFGHPLVRLNDLSDKTRARDYLLSLALDWDFTDWLKLHSHVDYRYNSYTQDVYQATTTSQDAYDNNGIAKINDGQTQNLLTETYLTFHKTFADKHDLTAMVGHSYNYDNGRGLYTTARGFINDILKNENMNASDPEMRQIYNDGYYESKLLSFYGRLNYSYDDKYLATLTMRGDGSTKFGKNNKWGFFPSGALSWKMHKEDWLSSVSWLSELKIRGSYGISGNQGINSYQTLDRYGMEKFWYDNAWRTVIGPGYEVGRTGANDRYFVWGGISNPDLKWESTGQADVGIDAAFFKRRLRITADYYYKHTTDLLREKYLPLTSSYDKIWVNDGSIVNQGVELSIEGDIVETRDFHFGAGLIFSLNRNKVVSLGDAVTSGLSKDALTGMFYEVYGTPVSMFNSTVNILAPGQPLNVFYGYKTDGIIQAGEDPGFIDPNGLLDQPGEIRYVDLDGDYEITDKDRCIIGNPNPKFTGSLNLSFSWKNLSVSAFFYGVYGNDVLYNGYTFSPRVKARRWTVDNPTNDFPRLNNGRQYMVSQYFIQDGSYLRLQNLNISYNFPIGLKYFESIRLIANFDNLFTLSKFDGYDPEVGLDGIYWGGYPKFRKFSLGVELNF